MKCPECNTEYEGKFCSNCGHKSKSICEWCGATNQTGKYCTNCRKETNPKWYNQKASPALKIVAILTLGLGIWSLWITMPIRNPKPKVQETILPNISASVPANNSTDKTGDKVTDDTSTEEYTSYQEILDDYSQKIKDATPILIEEYKVEAESNTEGMMGLATLSTNKMIKLAEISTAGTIKMAEYMYSNGSGSYDEYEKWATKLSEVYTSEASKITEEYMNSAK